MPVIPHGVPPFSINPPCTAGDAGLPSDSLSNDVSRVFHLIEDERHLTAHALLLSVQTRIAEWDRTQVEATATDHKNKKQKKLNKKEKAHLAAHEKKESDRIAKLKDTLKSKEAVLVKLENRCRLFRRAQQNLNENEDWTFASHHFGIKTYYRREEDQSLSIKLEGEVKDAALFEQVCVLKEVDLHYKWAPFCTSSMTIADLDKLDLVGWFLIGMPKFGMARDGCFRAVGCDNIQEDGSILLAGQGIHDEMPGAPQHEDTFLTSDPILEKLDIPPIPTRMGSGRMTIRKFEAVIHITSATSCNTKIVANVNPNISFLPNSLLEFAMKHMAGVLLARLQSASKKSVEQPLTNVHAIKMREERDFYQKWLMAKFQIICKAKGWEMPLVAAFQLPETHMHSHYELPRSHTFTCAALDDNMVDALPASRSLTLRESDTLSLLSVNTGSNSVRTNPISTYLREMEMKVQQRKENVIAEGRKRASDLLIPKALPSEKHERLSELRYAKAHRLALKDDVSAHDELCATASVAQRAFRRLFNHTPRTRYAIVLSLVCILFLMLHPEPLWLFWELNPKKSSRAVLIAQDCVMVAYIILCALPHFLLCDAALVYAFHALELGSKAGEHVKQFYSDKVRSAVAAGSLGIVAISILKSAAKAWTRSSIWFASQVISSFRVEVLPHLYKFGVGVLELVPLKFVFESLTVLLGLLRVPMKYAIWFVWSPIKVLFNVVFLLNPVGKYTLAFFALCLSVCRRALQNVHEFVASSIDAGNGKLPLVAWRLDAFHTAQSLFMYTSVFLVTTLVLFHLTAQRPPPPTEFLNNVVNHEKERSSMSTASMRIPLQSGTNKTFDREDPMKRNGNHASGTDSVGSGVRRRFRFREKKVSSLSTIPAGRTTGGAPETLSHARSF